MDLYSFIEEKAILSIDHLHSFEGQPLWLVLITSYNHQDFHAVKIPWIHDGIFNQVGQRYDNDYDYNSIYLCRNKENNNEYISVHDFIQKPEKLTNFNTIFANEEMADALINTIILTRSQTYQNLQKTLDDIVSKRSFAIQEKNNYSIFGVISSADSILVNLIPK